MKEGQEGIDKSTILCYFPHLRAVVTSRNRKSVRRLRHVLIDPEALHKAQGEVLRSKKTLEEWREEAIEEKIDREQKKVK